MTTRTLAASARALALSIALLGAGTAHAGSPCSAPAGALTGVLGTTDRVGFHYENTSGAASGVLSFSLFGCGTLDGFYKRYTDLFELTVNWNETMYGAFAMGGKGESDAWLDDRGGASGLNWSVFSPGSGLGGVTSISLTVPLLAGDNLFKFRYYTGISEGLQNEGWGVGSYTVTPVPEPEAYALMLAGLGLVGAMARRRRKG